MEIQLNTNKNLLEIQLKLDRSFNDIPFEISMKYQWKALGHTVETEQKFQ